MSTIAQSLAVAEAPRISQNAMRGRIALAFLVVVAPVASLAYVAAGCWAAYSLVTALI